MFTSRHRGRSYPISTFVAGVEETSFSPIGVIILPAGITIQERNQPRGRHDRFWILEFSSQGLRLLPLPGVPVPLKSSRSAKAPPERTGSEIHRGCASSEPCLRRFVRSGNMAGDGERVALCLRGLWFC